MGMHANLIIIKDQKPEVYHQKLGDCYVDNYLFWGPRFVVPWIRLHETITIDELNGHTDEGVIVDIDRCVLLWWGGNGWDVVNQRLITQLMAHSWSGWSVRYAAGGLDEMTEHLGVPRSKPIPWPPLRDKPFRIGLADVSKPLGYGSAITARLENGSIVAGISRWLTYEVLLAGSVVAESIRYANWPNEFTAPVVNARGGFHLDLKKRTLDYWTERASVFSYLKDHLESRWPGWRVQWHRDRFETQLALSQNHLTLTPANYEDVIKYLRQCWLSSEDDFYYGKAEIVTNASRYLFKDFEDPENNVDRVSLEELPLYMPLSRRTEIFEHALAAYEKDDLAKDATILCRSRES